ncbi:MULTISPECIES: hypothetical protein [Streptomyces]|uniref:hypothetical protein n=1 Tax=Streptomyces TaxID=1883 RepID=UPI001689B991|nr:hypothetical protein [Streptomyces venezuelae]
MSSNVLEGKPVRDRIPEIIRDNGEEPVTYTADRAEAQDGVGNVGVVPVKPGK